MTKLSPEEGPILKDLHEISQHLKDLKKKPYTLQDIEQACDKLGSVVQELRDVRQSEDSSGRNAVDDELDTIWLELFTLWAKVANIDKQLYPTFKKLTAIDKQLEEFHKTGMYTVADVLPLQVALTEIETTDMLDGKFVAHGQKHLADAGNPAPGQAILSGLLNRCRRLAHILLEKDEEIDPSLQPILAQLVAIQQKLSGLQMRGTYSLEDLHALQEKLDFIDSSKTASGDIPAGQARLSNILNTLYDQVQQMQQTKEVSGPLRPTFETLMEIGTVLEKLRHGKRFTVAPLDVAPLQKAMHGIEATRNKDGIFTVAGVDGIPPGQAACNQQLSHNYNLIHQLLSVADSVDDSLGPALDELSKIRAGLQQLARQARRYRAKRGGKQVTPSDLIAFQERMAEFEETHKRGDKIVPAGWKDGDVPSGQAVISSIESQVYSLLNELRH